MKRVLIITTSAMLLALFGAACDSQGQGDPISQEIPEDVYSGGKTTVFDTTRNAFTFSARNLGSTNKRRFFVGNSLFNENWVEAPASTTARDGLGPTFNALSCSSCHFKDGRGAPYKDEDTRADLALLFRLSGPDGAPLLAYGDQLNPQGIPGVPGEGRALISWKSHTITYDDGQSATLVNPQLSFEELAFGEFPEGVQISARTAPPVYGLGLLELIPEADLLAIADEDDRDGDGISGRPNYVFDRRSGAMKLGRFGWKSNQPSLEQQNAGAFLGDMGITSPLFPKDNCPEAQTECANSASGADETEQVELIAHRLDDVTFYTKTLAVPARRDWDEPEVIKGKALFDEAGCASCHTPRHVTGQDPEHPELSGQIIYPYTDLLLHDMGEGLADGRPDGLATGSEWRTPPLWGIGLTSRVNGHTRFMHDGRARDLTEAILWHGGEAEASASHFKALNADDRAALISFLESL